MHARLFLTVVHWGMMDWPCIFHMLSLVGKASATKLVTPLTAKHSLLAVRICTWECTPLLNVHMFEKKASCLVRSNQADSWRHTIRILIQVFTKSEFSIGTYAFVILNFMELSLGGRIMAWICTNAEIRTLIVFDLCSIPHLSTWS